MEQISLVVGRGNIFRQTTVVLISLHPWCKSSVDTTATVFTESDPYMKVKGSHVWICDPIIFKNFKNCCMRD